MATLTELYAQYHKTAEDLLNLIRTKEAAYTVAKTPMERINIAKQIYNLTDMFDETVHAAKSLSIYAENKEE